MMLLNYPSKKELKTCIGESLNYTETSMFGAEYLSNGTFNGANRPSITGQGREFIATITMRDGLIASVE